MSGAGIFVNQVGGWRLDEEGMHGGDVEAGWKVPKLDAWLHGAVYAFHGDDAPEIEGARVRASYALNDNLSLLAEGQYDAERGRQGWLGARVTVPFYGAGKKPEGLRARMTASPVRDVDIVTSAKTKATTRPTGTYAVVNTESGDAQRVIYVDNNHGGSNAGTLENPYTTLAAAEGALQNNDILYIAYGLGNATGMSDGLNIAHDNVMIIGEGSAFVYDGGRMTVGGRDYNGVVLKAAGLKPVITNTSAVPVDVADSFNAGVGIRAVDVENIRISGVAVDGALGAGIYVDPRAGRVDIDNVLVERSGYDGIHVQMNAGLVYDGVSVRDSVVNQSGQSGSTVGRGVVMYATGASKANKIEVDGLKLASNKVNLYLYANNNSEVGEISARNVNSTGSGPAANGVDIRAQNGAKVGQVVLSKVSSSGSANSGVVVGGTGVDSHIASMRLNEIKAFNNGSAGIFVNFVGSSFAGSVTIRDSDMTGNATHGIFVNNDSSEWTPISLTGGNRLFGNGSREMVIDLNGGSLDANGNWWGQPTGPGAGRIANESATQTGTAVITDWLGSDPRP